MLKQLFFGSAISILPILPAIAVDWRTTGVSRQTGETVAIDMNSINRLSQYEPNADRDHPNTGTRRTAT